MVAEQQQQQLHMKSPTILEEVMEELRRMKELGLPVIAINLVGYMKSMVSVMCMGRLGRLELAGGALAIGFTNITGYSVLAGLAMGMEPICGQAFGSGNPRLAVSALRRTVALLLAASLPIAALWVGLELMMLLLRQDPGVARVAGRYCLFALPDLAANSLLQPARVFLRSRAAPRGLMWCTAIAVLLHLPLTIFLSFTLNLGIAGVAVAASATNFNTLILLIAYTALSGEFAKPPEATTTTTKPATEAEWGLLLRFAVPSCLGVCLEWWWYELMTFASGYLGDPRVSLATSAIVIQTTSLMYTMPATLSSSVSARVGNELGAGRPSRARTSAAVSMCLAMAAAFLSLLWATLGREGWGKVFTGDGEVIELAKAVLPVIGVCELANCPQTTGCGVLRGSARPSVAAAINLYSFYLVGAPVAALLAVGLDWGFVGLCLGLLAAQVTCAVSVAVVVMRTDWEMEACKAMDLVGAGDVAAVLPQKKKVVVVMEEEEDEAAKSLLLL